MRIDKKLNLIIPVDTDLGTVFVHSVPLSREVFETYFMVISRTFAEIYRQKLEIVAGPRVAMILLRSVARDLGVLDDVETGLIAEIRRTTNVVVSEAGRGWTTYPLQDAIDRELLTEDDVSEVEGAVCFFICASAMHRRSDIPIILDSMASLWGAATTSLSYTEYVASLRKSTEAPASPTTTSSVPF